MFTVDMWGHTIAGPGLGEPGHILPFYLYIILKIERERFSEIDSQAF